MFTRVDVNQVPKGVVGIISPWNYPFTMAISDGIPALLAGNAVVHKPDSQTPLTALLGLDLLVEAGCPPDALAGRVRRRDRWSGGAIVDHADYVCFTGSTRTGRQVAAQAAERLIGASLELGGKNPMLVLRDADLDRAAEGAVRACFSSAGQLCVSMERMYVADQVYDRFMDRFVRRVEAMKLAHRPRLLGRHGVARLPATARHGHRSTSTTRSGKGATVVTGGKARPDIGPLFYEPTVLTGVTPAMACFSQRDLRSGRLGLPVPGRAGRGGACQRRQLRPQRQHLHPRHARGRDDWPARSAAAPSTSTRATARRSARSTSPMGGMRDSGLGRRQGAEGIHRYTEAQTVGTQRLLPFRPVLGMSEERNAKTLTLALRLLKRLHRP